MTQKTADNQANAHKTAAAQKTAASCIVEALIENGVSHVFCVPGESYLAVLDALYDVRDRIKLISCRHEASAANMAEAYGKLTGRPGVVMVTRGPGATQGSVGVHTAFQDSTPLVMMIGQVAREQFDREAFQEVDYRQMFGPLAKWVGQINEAERAGEYVNRAFATAQNGRKGPVVLALPEDMLTEPVRAPSLPAAPLAQAAPAPEAMVALKARLEAAARPILLIGGGGWTGEAVADVRRFAEGLGLPVAASFRAKDLFDNTHPLYAGDVGIGVNPALAARIKNADLVVALGPRLGEMTTSGYRLFEAPLARQPLVHIHPSAEELGRVYTPETAIQASAPAFLQAALALDWAANPAWKDQAAAAHQEFLAFSTPIEVESGVNLSKVFGWLSDNLSDDAIMCNGAGAYAAWLHRFYRHKAYKTQLAPTSGAMGYGFAAALAAKALYPSRQVVCAAGDGCFMMAASELATAMQYDLPVITVISNNGLYGTIRMHQERDFPGRMSGTALVNPNFAALAESYGAFGARIEHADEFPVAFEAARASGKPALIEMLVAPTPYAPPAP